jgi:hypothetical protein
VALCSLTVALSCAGTADKFEVRYATEFVPGPITVSVLGVFADGLLTPDAWASFAPRISSALQGSPCDSGYSETLHAARPELFSTLDRDARTDGIGDELFAKVAPAALGDHIIAFEMHGTPPGHAAGEQIARPPVLLAHGGGRSDVGPRLHISDSHPLEISASLFSVRLHHTVAAVRMEYRGSSRSEAITNFSDKLRSALPGSVCTNWDWSAIRSPADEKATGRPDAEPPGHDPDTTGEASGAR